MQGLVDLSRFFQNFKEFSRTQQHIKMVNQNFDDQPIIFGTDFKEVF